jgi:hypothetical protein
MCVFDHYEFSEEIWKDVQVRSGVDYIFLQSYGGKVKENERTNTGWFHDFQDVHIEVLKAKIK